MRNDISTSIISNNQLLINIRYSHGKGSEKFICKYVLAVFLSQDKYIYQPVKIRRGWANSSYLEILTISGMVLVNIRYDMVSEATSHNCRNAHIPNILHQTIMHKIQPTKAKALRPIFTLHMHN